MNWTLPDLLRATGGELLRWGPGPFRSVSTDSRRTQPGDVFVALGGPNHDGHDFIEAALSRGATGVVASREERAIADDVAWIRVGDTLEAFGDLGAARRRGCSARVVAVTGSNGKTTTKEMIASVLAASGARVARSIGTENNLVGVPQTLLRLEGREDFVVVEMGMNHAGEIWRLAEIADPDVGVLTNVGPAHLEGLGSLANVAAAKGELALAMGSAAILVVNAADPRLVPIADAFPGATARAGDEGPVRVVSTESVDERTQRVVLEIGGRTVAAQLRCVGTHNLTNALLAATVGTVLGLPAETIGAGLEAFVPPPMRLEIVRLSSGALVWNDAYNANPASMDAALVALTAEPAKRRIAVLGEMWELGDETVRYHREVGRRAAELGVDLLVAVGGSAPEIAAGAVSGGLASDRIRSCPSAAAAAEALLGALAAGDLVLVKGSRGAKMEEVVRRLEGAG